MNQKRVYKSYPKEFKEEAVALVDTKQDTHYKKSQLSYYNQNVSLNLSYVQIGLQISLSRTQRP